ncbi:monooxygenase family protein [Fusarium proliferatum ET1]|uniref:Related to monooxigenase n=1 Tax=Fusarium proliferatum (strain ET1) TaxID=1227346 RepID=A0A1L7VQA7_FUSPR|nr:monooxygenase family protein [Fusarium proliferatum ET1]CZR42542.1 related to monooxigenase [Fusarium proliferatum ET1]
MINDSAKIDGDYLGQNGYTAAQNESGENRPKFTLKDTPVENQRPMRVVIIGAGFSGIYSTIRMTQRLRNIDLTVYEMNEETSGVWWLNRYPGLACDIPSYSYQFSFAPNPYWSSLYAPGAEIRAYMQDVAERYGANRFIKTSHQVTSATWDSENKVWRLTVKNVKTGETFEDTANILVSAKGGLNQIAWPEIKGLKQFAGKLMHSGAWDESCDLRNKRVGVIGNGSSAIQIVPAIQKLQGISVTCFARSPTWIIPAFGDSAMQKLGMDPSETKFSRRHQEQLARQPEKFYRWRKTLEDEAATIYPLTLMGTDIQNGARELFRKQMEEKLQGRKDLQQIIPKFAPGCRRLTPGPGYLNALQQENVTFISQKIEEITERGIKVASGEEVQLDVLVCATGYDVEAPPTFEILGRNGKTLTEKWKPHFESYISLAVDGFPNLFFIGGPNCGLGSGSLLSVFEAQGDYIVKAIRKLQKEDYATMEAKPERVADFSQYIDEYFKGTVYTDECSSWYRSGRLGSRIVALWPGSSVQCLEVLRSPRWEDYEFESADPTGNLLRWMGNGWSQVLTEGDPSWFLDPDVVDAPDEGKPEEGEFYRRRPFSY